MKSRATQGVREVSLGFVPFSFSRSRLGSTLEELSPRLLPPTFTNCLVWIVMMMMMRMVVVITMFLVDSDESDEDGK